MILVNTSDELLNLAATSAQSEPHRTGICCSTQPYACTCVFNNSCDL